MPAILLETESLFFSSIAWWSRIIALGKDKIESLIFFMHKLPPSQKDSLHLIRVQLETERKTERIGLASEMSCTQNAGSSAGAWARSQDKQITNHTTPYPSQAIYMPTLKTSCLKCILEMEISLRSARHIPSDQAALLQPPPTSQRLRVQQLICLEDLIWAQFRWSKTGACAPYLVINKKMPLTRRGYWVCCLKS